MNSKTPTRTALVLAMAAAASGCSMIADLFPDKQKQYRYSTDLPPLEIPPDLGGSSVGSVSTGDSADSGAVAETEPADEAATATPKSSDRSKRRDASKPAPTTLAQSSDDAPLIEIEEPFAEAWNDVHRALGRLEVEVTDQNRSEGVFFVNYGGTPKASKDEGSGLWHDIKSVFSGSGGDGQDFRVLLEEEYKVTKVSVRDSSNKIVSDGPGLELLKKLSDKLQALDDGAGPGDEGESDKARER